MVLLILWVTTAPRAERRMMYSYNVPLPIDRNCTRLWACRCAELVHEEMVRIAGQCEDGIGELRRFTGLRQRINDVVIEFLRTRLDPTQQMIESIVGMELAYINTNHPDFVGGQEGGFHAYGVDWFLLFVLQGDGYAPDC